MTPERNANSEPTIISTDSEDNLQNVAQDAFPENQPDQLETQPEPDQQETQPEPDRNPEPSSPGKENTTFVATPLQIGKEIMLSTTQWSLAQTKKLSKRIHEIFVWFMHSLLN